MKAGNGSTAWATLPYLAIPNGVVVADKLASNAVTTAKILDANVTADKLASNAVTTAKITDLNVTEGKLAAGAVTTAKLNSAASIGLVNSKSFMVQTTQPTTRPGGGALVTGDVWISYTA
jgi:glycerol uptake facilitator-like aquaporin